MKNGRAHPPTRRTAARLFISYRRRLDAPNARLLKDELTRAFGEGAVFRDVDDIEPGQAFPETIREAVEACDAFLLLVGPGWVESIARLHDPEDFVRRETAAALARGVPFIPILLGGARMPKADDLPEEIRGLAFRHAIELTDERWDYDVGRLVKLVRGRTGAPEPAPLFKRAVALRSFFGTWPGKTVAAVAVLAALLLAARMLFPLAARYALTRDLEGCVSWYAPDWLGGVAKIELGDRDVPVVRADEYRRIRERRDEPGVGPLVVTLKHAGEEVGAVFLRFRRADVPDDSTFTVERVVAPPCADVQDYSNDSTPAGDKHFLKSWDRLRVRLGGRDYYLRTGDKGDHVRAALMPTPTN
jgi:hypothetical protein